VELRMPVQELAQERAPGALHLGDQDERLADLHQVLEPDARELHVLAGLAQVSALAIELGQLAAQLLDVAKAGLQAPNSLVGGFGPAVPVGGSVAFAEQRG